MSGFHGRHPERSRLRIRVVPGQGEVVTRHWISYHERMAYNENVPVSSDLVNFGDLGNIGLEVHEEGKLITVTPTDEDGAQVRLELSVAEALDLIAKLTGAVSAALQA
jgi:hypothetical protein